jgi:cardiolipin synthase A/B
MARQELDRHLRIGRVLRRLHRRSGEGMSRTFPAGPLEFIPDGPHFFQCLFDALDTAHSSICLEYYCIHADQTGLKLAEILSSACLRGVRVYLIYDYIGCLDTPESFFRSLRQHGVRCIAFNPLSFRRGIHWFDRRDHRKLAIIDGTVAFLGGRNIGNEYAGVTGNLPLFNDVGLTLSGPAVAYLSYLFSEVWLMEKGEPPGLDPEQLVPGSTDSTASITLINGGPHQRRSVIRSAFRVAMATAERELLIANPYFLPGPLILRSLLRASRRGVHIRLLLPAESDVPIVRLLSRGTYEQLLRAGIEIYEMQEQILHAKLMLVDGVRTVIGSANMDQRSFHRNYEINAHIHCPSFGSQVRTHLLSDFFHARRITLDEHHRRGLSERFMEWLLRPISWFL